MEPTIVILADVVESVEQVQQQHEVVEDRQIVIFAYLVVKCRSRIACKIIDVLAQRVPRPRLSILHIGVFALHTIIIGTCIVRFVLIPIKIRCACLLAIDDLIHESTIIGRAILFGCKFTYLELLSIDALHQAENAHILTIGIDLDILTAITIDGVGFLFLMIRRMRIGEPYVHRNAIAHLRMVGRHAIEDPVVVLAHSEEPDIERITLMIEELKCIVRLVEKKRCAASTTYGTTESTCTVGAMIDHLARNEGVAIE